MGFKGLFPGIPSSTLNDKTLNPTPSEVLDPSKFPWLQDLDDEFLVIWPGFGADQPWQQLSDTEV